MYCQKMKPYIRFMELFVSSMGNWPYQTTRVRYIMRIVFGFALTTLSIPLIVGIYKARNNFNYFIVCLPMTVTVIFLSWIYFIFFGIKKQELLNLLNHISKDFETLQSFEMEIQILGESADEGRVAIFIYIIYTISSTIFYCGLTFMPQLLNIISPLNETRPRSYISEVDYVFIDRDDYYFLTFLHTAGVGSYCVMLIVAGDVMLYLFTQHACGMFRVLRYRLKQIADITRIDRTLIQENDEEKMFMKAVSCLKMYSRILQFTENIDSCFSMCLLLVIGIIIVLMSFQGAMIIMKIDETEFVIRYSTYAFAQIIHLLYNSVTGQILLNHSIDVTNYIYDFEWYDAPTRVQKLLFVMMMRSLRESKITIGKISVLCLETYCSIMKTIFSYLSVLTSMT